MARAVLFGLGTPDTRALALLVAREVCARGYARATAESLADALGRFWPRSREWKPESWVEHALLLARLKIWLGEVDSGRQVFESIKDMVDIGRRPDWKAEHRLVEAEWFLAERNFEACRRSAQPNVNLRSKTRRVQVCRLETLMLLGACAVLSGEYEPACKEFRRAEALSAQLGIVRKRAQCANNLALSQFELQQVTRALGSIGRAAEIFRKLGDVPDMMRVEVNRAVFYLRMGKQEMAEKALARALPAGAPLDVSALEPDWLALVQAARAMAKAKEDDQGRKSSP
ncbi:MAG: hypothetical protein HYZ26_12475 [Chloroflexi bacterium]|nr:hypothetical protein [Chloroflexota bacterium]